MARVMVAVWRPVRDLHRMLGDDVVVRRALDDQGRYAGGEPFDVLLTADVDDPRALELAGLGERVWAWTVQERHPRIGRYDCSVTMVALMRRAPATTPEEFTEHWTTHHAPLALEHHEGLHDYVQNVVLESLTPDADEIDGIAVLGFQTREDFETRFYDSEAGRSATAEDVRRFMAGPGPDTTLVAP